MTIHVFERKSTSLFLKLAPWKTKNVAHHGEELKRILERDLLDISSTIDVNWLKSQYIVHPCKPFENGTFIY